jgi:hypothetical protein
MILIINKVINLNRKERKVSQRFINSFIFTFTSRPLRTLRLNLFVDMLITVPHILSNKAVLPGCDTPDVSLQSGAYA